MVTEMHCSSAELLCMRMLITSYYICSHATPPVRSNRCARRSRSAGKARSDRRQRHWAWAQSALKVTYTKNSNTFIAHNTVAPSVALRIIGIKKSCDISPNPLICSFRLWLDGGRWRLAVFRGPQGEAGDPGEEGEAPETPTVPPGLQTASGRWGGGVPMLVL